MSDFRFLEHISQGIITKDSYDTVSARASRHSPRTRKSPISSIISLYTFLSVFFPHQGAQWQFQCPCIRPFASGSQVCIDLKHNKKWLHFNQNKSVGIIIELKASHLRNIFSNPLRIRQCFSFFMKHYWLSQFENYEQFEDVSFHSEIGHRQSNTHL